MVSFKVLKTSWNFSTKKWNVWKLILSLNITCAPSPPTAAFPPLLDHRGGQVLTQPHRGAGRQDGDQDGPEEGREEGDHGEGGRVHPVAQQVGLALGLEGGPVVGGGGGEVGGDGGEDGTYEGIDRSGGVVAQSRRREVLRGPRTDWCTRALRFTCVAIASSLNAIKTHLGILEL